MDEVKIKKPGVRAGFRSVFTGLSLSLKTPGMRRYLIIPFILNALFLGLLVFVSIEYLYPYLSAMLPQDDSWYWAALRFVAKPLFVIVTFLFIVIVYSITGTLICAPFADPLSEKIEILATGRRKEIPLSIARIMKSLLRVIKSTVLLIIIIVLFNLVILLLNFIPVIGNIVYTVTAFLSLMFFLGFQMFDVVLERHDYSFGKKFSMVWKYKGAAIGIGFGFLIVTYIPFAGFLAPLVASAGATLIYCRGESGR
jgi:CysZ protein